MAHCLSLGERLTLRALERLGFEGKLIATGDSPYLIRVYLFRKWRKRLPGVFLHCFLRGDTDRELHNHPWTWAYSFILSGGYIEERRVPAPSGPVRVQHRIVRPFSLNRICANDFHRVDLLRKHCWSLFIAGPREQHWGFWDRDSNSFRVAPDSRPAAPVPPQAG